MNFFRQVLRNPKLLVITLLNKFGHNIPDNRYIKYKFRLELGYTPDLEHPRTFNEKLNWLKLNHREDLYTRMADKYQVKEYISNTIGDEYVVPLIGVWENMDEIDIEVLPSEFVLKATHDSSGAIVCRAKDNYNQTIVAKHFNKVMDRNYFYSCREWPYKNIKPRIIAEVLLKSDDCNSPMRDYKFMCFNGVPRLMYCTVKGTDVYENYYDMNFNPVSINRGFPRHIPEFAKPQHFTLMKDLAEKLAKDIPFVRIDFYESEGRVYFGEFTFYDWGGFKPFKDIEWDYKLGDWINLPEIK